MDNNLAVPHFSVMLKEVIDFLEPSNNKSYLDCTFGAGGYTKAILQSADCFVTAIDQDPNVKQYADKLTKQHAGKFNFLLGNFADSYSLTSDARFDGIVVDLGVSSMQLDEAQRGFSFMRDGKLDMRMKDSGYSAAEFIANASEEKIADVIYKYGQEVQSRQIAKAIVKEREKEPITTTLRLAEIVRSAMHYRKSKIDPATKTFQAIRIYINEELKNLEIFLNNLHKILKPGGRILIVSFHSLEDSIVKHFFREYSAKKIAQSKYSNKPLEIDGKKWLQIITKKPIMPSKDEIIKNHRSRSARLRVAKKLEGVK